MKTKLFLFKVLLMCVCMLFSVSRVLYAQTLEQDCTGAIVVTASPDTFPPYFFWGQIEELQYLQNSTCLLGGEENSVWITFTSCDTGTMLFQIKPDSSDDDFDWALYDFTNHTCADVFNLMNEMRCNYSATPGMTGVEVGFSLTSVDAFGPNQCAPLHPYVNQRFLLLVNNHSNDSSHFILTFSGTATLCNTVGVPEIKSANKFFLYPNPSDGKLQLKNLPSKNNLVIEVMNVYGNKVYERELNGSEDAQLELPPLLPDGFYVLRILSEGKLFAEESFIISR